MEPSQVEQSILAVTRVIATDIAYLENDDMGHFDPISIVGGVAVLLLSSFFEGVRDAAKDGGKRVGLVLTEKLAGLFSTKKARTSGSPEVLAAAERVRRSDLERYGDAAQLLVVAALVKNGLPLRKAEVLASTVRAEADRIVVHQPS